MIFSAYYGVSATYPVVIVHMLDTLKIHFILHTIVARYLIKMQCRRTNPLHGVDRMMHLQVLYM